MAKDFFQDITPNEPRQPRRVRSVPVEKAAPPMEEQKEAPQPVEIPERSIRNINVSRPKPMERFPEPPPVEREERAEAYREARPSLGIKLSMWLWVVAAILLVVLIVLVAFVFKSTSVDVYPRAHTVLFDPAKVFTAYPEGSAPSGALSYIVQTIDLDDAQNVASTGSAHVDRKASGSITLYNEFSTAPVKLVKSTRFQTPDGLIFRAPADVSIPGMKGAQAGSVTITVVADQPGEKYNVPATPRFTLPGLKGGAMFDKVYGKSSAAFAGGFSGNEPSVAQDVKDAAVKEMQTRLSEKLFSQIASSSGAVAVPGIASVSYALLPSTAASAGQVTLNLRAHAQIPVFPAQAFSQTIATAVSADAENATIDFQPQKDFSGALSTTSSALGSSPAPFTLSGSAKLVWEVNAQALAQGLAGKNDSVFKPIVQAFPGVQEARARIEPFWRHTFPSDPAQIRINVLEPKEAASQP